MRWALLSELVCLAKEWESGSTAETAYINLDNSCPAQHLSTKGIAATYTAN